jgi:tRNA-dihydrouridine synthase
MSCETANNNATPPSPAIAPGGEGIDAAGVAAELGRRGGGGTGGGSGGGADPRVTAILPAFDAPFFQAGLAGYSDAAMRIIARRHGCPLCVTEALLDRTLLAGGKGFVKADLGEIADNVPGGAEDHPLVGQIMGSDPHEMAAAAIKMIEQGKRPPKDYRMLAYNGTPPSQVERCHLRQPGGKQVGVWPVHADLKGGVGANGGCANGATPIAPVPSERTFATIDVNLACPVKKIDKKARGGHWLSEPDGAIAILKAVRDALPASIPCTVKLRRAYDDTPEMARNFERIIDACFDLGYAWATVHARTVEQKYIGPSRWDILRDIVARRPGRLIFGSGDVWEAADIFRMIAYTGVVGVSVARGCIGNPWIFRQARDMLAGRVPQAPTLAEQRAVLLEHFELSVAVNGEGLASRTMRKFGIRFAAHHPRAEEVRRRFIGVTSLGDWHAVLERYYGPRPGEVEPMAGAGAESADSGRA